MIDAEQLGFDSVWAGEEHFYSFGICPSPQLFLTAVAQATTRVRLGTASAYSPWRTPSARQKTSPCSIFSAVGA
jgi:alkanesulfonate monooxygenase SsuD/methylene tetrahydromethanopterin reductase-like flavin-dependent oxidoreductase (luciferase family)